MVVLLDQKDKLDYIPRQGDGGEVTVHPIVCAVRARTSVIPLLGLHPCATLGLVGMHSVVMAVMSQRKTMKAFIPFDVCRLRDFVEDSLDIYRVGLQGDPVPSP